MVLETLWPDNAPWWLNLFIWMAFSWQWILIAFVPAFYTAIMQLFGFPLLQRWKQEVVIILDPTKIGFGKITEEMEPYIKIKKGLYWKSEALQPEPTDREEIIGRVMDDLQKRYEELTKTTPQTKKVRNEMRRILKHQKSLQRQSFNVEPLNTLHIFTRPINQEVFDCEVKNEEKTIDILNCSTKVKKIKNHGIWIMQNPKAHFHRHWKLVISPWEEEVSRRYKLIPVKTRQQFGFRFWHSVGIDIQKMVPKEGEEIDSASGSGSKELQLVQKTITTSMVLEQLKRVQDFQNFSASKAYMNLEHRRKIEDPFSGVMAMVTGKFDIRIILALGGMLGAVVALYMFMGGGSSPQHPGGGLHFP